MTHVTPATDTRPHVLVIGGGFGGLTAARALAGAPVRVTLLDRTNHHTFQPLLYQVAMAGLSPAEIAQPSRAIVHTQENVTVLMAKAERVDLAAHQVRLEDGLVLIGFRNRIVVLINWAWSYVTYGRGARLVTGEPAERMRAVLGVFRTRSLQAPSMAPEFAPTAHGTSQTNGEARVGG